MDEPTLEQAEEPTPPKDLKAELLHELSTQFAAALESDASLPPAARKALIELLYTEALTADQIIAAASKSDPKKDEAPDD